MFDLVVLDFAPPKLCLNCKPNHIIMCSRLFGNTSEFVWPVSIVRVPNLALHQQWPTPFLQNEYVLHADSIRPRAIDVYLIGSAWIPIVFM